MNKPGIEGGDISFVDYVQAVEGVQLQMFYKTAKGKLALGQSGQI